MMREPAWTTPPRPVIKSRRDLLPRLTPSSSDGSSSSASPTNSSRSSKRRTEKGDKTILRGAAVVRERILQRLHAMSQDEDDNQDNTNNNNNNNNICHDDYDDDDSAWSDPFRASDGNGDGWSKPVRINTEEQSSTHWSFVDDYPEESTSWAEDALNDVLSDVPERTFRPLGWEDIDGKPQQEMPAPPHARNKMYSGRAPSDMTITSDGTPVTSMGRGRSLKVKMVTYTVQRTDEIGDDTTMDGSILSFDEQGVRSYEEPGNSELAEHEQDSDEYEDENDPCASYIPKKFQTPQAGPKSPPKPDLPVSTMGMSGISPLNPQFAMLSRDPAYMHAREAGYLWQTLVGQHVRFPYSWWDGARAPQMGVEQDGSGKLNPKFAWKYIARHKVQDNKVFKHLVRNRSAPGRLLLHIVVRDLMTWAPVQDIAVGVFHPNARGIRLTQRPAPSAENTREVWMAVRRRTAQENAVSVMDPLLCRGEPMEQIATESPLGNRRKVTNTNMKAVFGEKPPLHTIFILESELYEKMMLAIDIEPDSARSPTLLLLQEFLTLG